MAGDRAQTGHGNADEDLVTVVVPARDEQAAIGPCLDSILAQTHQRLQVIVVDGASRDGTARLVKERARDDARVELLANPRGLIPISLNLGLAAARGRWFVRVDAHAVVPPRYVEGVVRHLATGRWGGVGGRKDGVGRTSAGRAVAMAMASPFGVGNSAYHYATEPRIVDHIPFGAYPVELARALGGWDERLAVNQDFEFDVRVRQAGHQLLLDPSLVINWECRQTIGGLWRQYHRYGRGKVAVARLHPSSVQPRHLAAPTLVAGVAAALLAVALGRRRVAAGLVAPYLAGLAAATAVTAPASEDPAARVRLPLAFGAMHLGWGVGFWRGVLDLLLGRSAAVRPRDETERSDAGVGTSWG